MDPIHAEEHLKAKTRQYVFDRMAEKKKKRKPLRRWSIIAAAACFVCIFLAGGHYLYFTPTAFISVDVNPSLEIEVNRFDRVIEVTGYNRDGKNLAKSLDIKYLNYQDALDQILEDKSVRACLEEDGDLSLTLAGDNETQCGKIRKNLESCALEHENVYCHSGSLKQREDAHEAGVSFGKYQAFLVLKELDPSVTLEDVRDMTMHEIRARIRALSENQGGENSNYQEESYGHGHGHGYTKGRGHHRH